MSLFRKAAIFTDIHFGEKLDAEIHNQDCLEFVQWFCQQARDNDCDTIIFMGDWFHNRARTENRTADYSIRALEELERLERPIYFLLGNHDIYFKNSRDIHALPVLPRFTNIHLIDTITQKDDVVFSPWLLNEEREDIMERRCKYIFGHFELPFFLMNQSIAKKYDGEGLHIDDFSKCEAVYSGHFHKRQVRINRNKVPIYYIGNCFGHNFNDTNDFERGMAILKWGDITPEYIAWDRAPTYQRYNVSQFLDMLERGDIPNARSTLELKDDLGLDDDATNALKSAIEARWVRVIPTDTAVVDESDKDEDDEDQDLDTMVENLLMTMNYSGNYDPKLLVHIYNNLSLR